MPVGASIISIITESLYDKPIVVFREYVQNSVDAFSKTDNNDQEDAIDITIQTRGTATDTSVIATDAPLDIYFLDNGRGIDENEFKKKMIHIAKSSKQKVANIGYKGIGRLSGISYCQRLTFLNILSYKEKRYQVYSIDCQEYRKKKNTQEFLDSEVETAINLIGKKYDKLEAIVGFDAGAVYDLLQERKAYFRYRDTGFLVVMEDISHILADTVDTETKFIEALSWLLPVQFKEELKEHEKYGILFQGLSEDQVKDSIPAKGYPVWLHMDSKKQKLERPITVGSLRDYVFVRKFKDAQDNVYAIALYSVNNDRIAIDKKNSFSGIKVYIDNMLLCDENELLTMLKNLNLTTSTPNELMQTVRAVGVMLYIVDKVSLSANARRTFIDISDTEAVDFLQLISDFIAEIYTARYALSDYAKGITRYAENRTELEKLRNKALTALQTLAVNQVKVELAVTEDNEVDFADLSTNEKKQVIKKIIMEKIGADVKLYLSLTTDFKKDTAYRNFVDWLANNK